MGGPDQRGPDQRLFDGALMAKSGVSDGRAERSLVGYTVKQYEKWMVG